MSGRRGLALSLLLTAAALGAQHRINPETLGGYDRHVLPAFDAYVYLAMADHPGVFTLPPWGYRIAAPWLAHLLPLPSSADAFRAVTYGALLAAGGLVFLLVRRLGAGTLPALAAVVAYGLSPAVGSAVSYVFLTDPLTLVLELTLLLALESGCGAGVLALVFVAGALTKEVFLLFLPAVFFVRARRGWRRAAFETAAALAAALLAGWVLRSWAPHIRPAPFQLPGLDTFWLAVYRILAGWDRWLGPALLGGVLPLAALGALRRQARPLLVRYGYLLLVTLTLPFAASVYTDDSRMVPFFAEDVPRLLLLALPVLLPLALLAVDRVYPHWHTPIEPRPWSWRTEAAAAACAVALAVAPLLGFDSYRRLDLRGPRDGRWLLALSRESLAFGHRLDWGKLVNYDPEGRRFSPARSDPRLLERMRWFLRDGWGPSPHYGTGPVVMQAPEAGLVLPCLRPAELEVVLTLSAPDETRLRVELNGGVVGELGAGAAPARHALRIPARLLFRGDNLLRLIGPSASAGGTRLHELSVRRVLAPG